jgi:hypothetical protein
MQSNFKFALALLVGAVFGIMRDGFWKRVSGFFWTIRHRDDRVVPEAVARERMDWCQTRCPLFYERLGTCGSPLSAEYQEKGCYCFMERKVTMACNCWLYDKASGKTLIGWPHRLNSFPYEQLSPSNQ